MSTKYLKELIGQLEDAAGVENKAAELFKGMGGRHDPDKLDVALAKAASQQQEFRSVLSDKLLVQAAELRDWESVRGQPKKGNTVSEGDVVATVEEGKLFMIRHGAGRQLEDGVTAVSPDSPVGKAVMGMKSGQIGTVYLPGGITGKITLK
jgi:hypothetical protein